LNQAGCWSKGGKCDKAAILAFLHKPPRTREKMTAGRPTGCGADTEDERTLVRAGVSWSFCAWRTPRTGKSIPSGHIGRWRTKPGGQSVSGSAFPADKFGQKRTPGGQWLPSDLESFFSHGAEQHVQNTRKSLEASLQLLQQSRGASQARSGHNNSLPAAVPLPAIPHDVFPGLFQQASCTLVFLLVVTIGVSKLPDEKMRHSATQ